MFALLSVLLAVDVGDVGEDEQERECDELLELELDGLAERALGDVFTVSCWAEKCSHLKRQTYCVQNFCTVLDLMTNST